MASDTELPSAPVGFPPFSFGPDDPNLATQDLVTPQMSCAVHLDGKFANTVAAELLTTPHRAVWPVWRLDYWTLARHARMSRERRSHRDMGLCLTAILLALSWGILLLSLATGRLPVGWGLFGLVFTLIAVLVAAYAQVWIFYERTVAIVEAITLDPEAAKRLLDAWESDPKGPGLPGAAAQIMENWHRWYVGRVRTAVRDFWRQVGRKQKHTEMPVQSQPGYVQALADANVAYFARGADPFDLAGVHLDSWTVTVDLGTYNASAVTAADLHKRLLAEVPQRSLPNLRSESLYVVSGMQPVERGLFPPERQQANPDGWYLEHPETRIAVEALDDLITSPPEGGRVYAYFQKYSWRGQLIVGAAVRVYRAENTLYLEFDTHALPPLADGFNNMYQLPTTPRTRRQSLRRTTLAHTPTLLSQSPRAMYLLYFKPRGRVSIVRDLHEKNEDDARIDYGSTQNLRLKAGDKDKLWRHPYRDQLDDARVLRDRVLLVTEKYLLGHGVKLDEYKEQVRILRERKTSYDVEGP